MTSDLVSFPQLSDATRVVKKETKTFKDINYYDAGTEIWNGGLQQNVVSSYLLVEGWDENWKNKEETKTISLIIDVNGLNTLEVNLRAGALNETNTKETAFEIVPVSGDLDQQNYPINFIEIPILRTKLNEAVLDSEELHSYKVVVMEFFDEYVEEVKPEKKVEEKVETPAKNEEEDEIKHKMNRIDYFLSMRQEESESSEEEEE